MKNININHYKIKKPLLFLILLLVISCKGKNDYKMTAKFMTTGSSGIPFIVDETVSFEAANDSLASENGSARYQLMLKERPGAIGNGFYILDYKDNVLKY